MNDNLGYIGTEVEMLYGKRVLSLKLLNYDSLYYAVIGVIHSVPRPSPRPRGSARRKTASSLSSTWPHLNSDVGLEKGEY